MATCMAPPPEDISQFTGYPARAITKNTHFNSTEPHSWSNVNTQSFGHNINFSQNSAMPAYTGSMQYFQTPPTPQTLTSPKSPNQHLATQSNWVTRPSVYDMMSSFSTIDISDIPQPISNSPSLPLRPTYEASNMVAGTGPSLSDHSRRMNSWPSAQTSPPPIGTKERRQPVNDGIEEMDSDEEDDPLHPNKFPTVLEFHTRKECGYVRQATRSGPKVKQVSDKVYNPYTGQHEIRQRAIKYYEKDLVRNCICGKYEDKTSLLTQGRSNDCKGYEIHYSQKCKWKGYTDFHTKETVLIRLCKCYKPT